MAYDTDEKAKLSGVIIGSYIIASIFAGIAIFLKFRNYVSTNAIQIIIGLFLFCIVLPTLILSTLVNAIMFETKNAIDVTCPSHCQTGGGTGRSVSNLSTKSITIGICISFVIGIILWLAHRMHVARLRYDTILKLYTFLFAILLFPGLIVSTTISSTLHEDIQFIMGNRDCSRCTSTS